MSNNDIRVLSRIITILAACGVLCAISAALILALV